MQERLSWTEQFFGVGPPPPNYGTPYSSEFQKLSRRSGDEFDVGPWRVPTPTK